MVNTILKEADLFCPNSVQINFTIYQKFKRNRINRSKDFRIWRYVGMKGLVQKDIYQLTSSWFRPVRIFFVIAVLAAGMIFFKTR
ncbi:hypothetical protein GBP40_08420 [Pediococcus acidilactici]|nr:hypothetical protein GBP06_10185 [Pediococcus acidilactici]KAF0540763.1 hypothetical protein GBP40_08420 [Pediococcus acidilactici]